MDYGLWLYNVDDLFIVTSINIQRINMLYECPTQYYNVAPPSDVNVGLDSPQ